MGAWARRRQAARGGVRESAGVAPCAGVELRKDGRCSKSPNQRHFLVNFNAIFFAYDLGRLRYKLEAKVSLLHN